MASDHTDGRPTTAVARWLVIQNEGASMKRIAVAAALAAASLSPALATDVGVSVSIGQPGFYGRIDIGNYPQPQLIYPQPVVIAPAPYAVVQQPIYLHVPPGHAKDWRKHCGRYNACGQRVYFVQDSWYQNVYVPAYQGRGGGKGDKGRGADKGNNGQGKGQGKGHGNGNGKGRD
jgi:hypothetical protein